MARKLFTFTAALLVWPLVSNAQTFPEPHEFSGRFRVESAVPGKPVHAGAGVKVSASGLKPGQTLVLKRGAQDLLPAPVLVDEKGQASVTFDLPADAAAGIHPVIAILEEPAMVSLVDLKISKEMAYQGEANWAVQAVSPAKGLYQSAYSPKNDALFVTGADFYTGASELLKLDPKTLDVLARITPADFPEDQKLPKKPGKPGLELTPAGVYGLGLDDKNGRIWVTNTPDNTIAIYNQSDLSLVRQLPPGTVYHSRDVILDPVRNLAFVSSSATSNIYVFDSETFEEKLVITIQSAERGGDFYVMSLALDAEAGELYVASRVSNELAVIDAQTLEVKRVLPIPGAKNATGLDVDPATGRLFVAAQDTDNLLILDRTSGAVLHDVAVGAGALNVEFDAATGLAWVASRQSGSLSAVNANGEVVAHLPGGSYANHISSDGKGAIFAVNKALSPQDPDADYIRRITAKN